MKTLKDTPFPTRLKLSALWTATMFCYVYGDNFGLYVPNKLASVAQGRIGLLGEATSGTFVAVSLLMAVPSLLIASSLLVPAAISRWSNLLFGVLYTAIIAISMPGARPFYITLAIIEMLLTASIVLIAWAWPTIDGDGI